MKLSLLAVSTHAVIVINAEGCVRVLLNLNKENSFADCMKCACFDVIAFTFFYFNAVYFVDESTVVDTFNEILFGDVCFEAVNKLCSFIAVSNIPGLCFSFFSCILVCCFV